MKHKFSTLQQIISIFDGNEKLKPSQIAVRLAKTTALIHLYLKQLVAQGKIIKEGKTPHVTYRLADSTIENVSRKAHSHTFSYKQTQLLDQSFAKYDATGHLLQGTEGFLIWCEQRKLDPYLKYNDYQSIYNHLQSLSDDCGLLDATEEFAKHVTMSALDKLYYADQYRWLEFGRGKLAELTFYAKQSQNIDLLHECIDLFVRKLECLIRREHIDALAFIPPSIKREYQILDVLDKKIAHIVLPRVHIVKYYPNKISIPQKSLKTRDERKRNAKMTIFVNDDKVRQYKRILIIDDFVGSGSTLNETVIKLKQQGVKYIIGFAIVGNLDLSYDVINEV